MRNLAHPSTLCSLESPPLLNLLPWEVAQRAVSPALGFMSGSGDDGKDLDMESTKVSNGSFLFPFSFSFPGLITDYRVSGDLSP